MCGRWVRVRVRMVRECGSVGGDETVTRLVGRVDGRNPCSDHVIIQCGQSVVQVRRRG